MSTLTKEISNSQFLKAASQKLRSPSDLKNKHLIPEPYRKIAKGMEKQFVKHMIEQMDKTIDRSEKTSSAEDYYKALTQGEYAEKVTKNDTLGLQDVILDQVYPQRLRNELAYKNFVESQKRRIINKSNVAIKDENPYEKVQMGEKTLNAGGAAEATNE